MNKISCNVCKDLLPIYVDKLCSEESEQLVENHLSGCEDCRNTYEAMTDKISVPKIDEEEKDKTDEFKLNLNKKWHRFLTTRAIAISTISIVGLAAIILGIYFLFFHYYYVSGKDIGIVNLCRLDDGRIAMRLFDVDSKKGFNNVKLIPHKSTDADGENTLYVVVENQFFDKSDDPTYVACDIYENDIIQYDSIVVGKPDDKYKKCVWTSEISDVSEASGNIARYFYKDIDSFSKVSNDGDVWVNDDLGIKITYYNGFENYDTTIALPIIKAEIKDYYYRDNVYNIKNKNGDILRDGNFIVGDDQVNNQLYFTVSDHIQTDDYLFYTENITFKYAVKDKNTIELILYSDMGYDNMFGPFGKKIEIHKSSEKAEMTDDVKRILIGELSFIVDDENGFNSKKIDEFYYNKSDSAVEMAYKIEIADLDKVENLFNNEESEEFSPINKKDVTNYSIDWWKFDNDNVVEAYKSQYGWGLTDMYGDNSNECVIVKENNKYYLYNYTKIVMRTADDVKEEYDNMDNWEIDNK